ncbi:hypothetical protein HH219_15040 [Pseudoalteromonas sp. NEC-BIFX-2020_015]|uniref:winged helix-turn-helix domain-containing protein n=1 Tax=Pseudoalteromonas sp. NEC-BIFX-2020_015 TaxID=2729544 RepID=UPI00146136AD|nr:winged helix-turn-helix domain-containing protein [Pseudoalteromonas sp. NEC-BIFX-2020_015]NMR26826.1 hypothetical protein [Pseudoalteromonas sp. NEC-BIFX-2020_015]
MIKFTVEDYQVDLARSQIIHQGDVEAVEPKILQVLLVLAQKQGDVVSHEEILTQVWPDTYVAPNALQRCIAQLRKAFKDDAKKQWMIKTHPKRGYSLIGQVTWHQPEQDKIIAIDSPITNSDQGRIADTDNKTEVDALPTAANKSWRMFFGLALALLVLIILASIRWWPTNHNTLPIKHMTALTTTHNKEYSPSFSPDGRYIVFERHINPCENQIWAKDTNDNKEYLLTKKPSLYGPPAWSPDGSQIAFAQENHCGEEQIPAWCSDIQVLSFALAKSKPQLTRSLVPCGEKYYKEVVWLSNEKIAFVVNEQGQGKVVGLNLATKQRSTIYSAGSQVITQMDFSTKFNSIALIQHDEKRIPKLVLVDPENKEFIQVALQPPQKFKHRVYWPISWHPHRQLLLSTNKNSLFEIDLQGRFTEYSIPSMHGFYGVDYHPDGNKLLSVMSFLDFDIAEFSWHELPDEKESALTFTQEAEHYQVFHRSIVNEKSAQYQPRGQHIAFLSERNGPAQIWLSSADKSILRQLTELSLEESVTSFRWTPSGDSLIMVANRKLYLVNLSGNVQPLTAPFEVIEVYQVMDNNQVLLSIIEQGKIKLVKFNIETFSLVELYEGDSILAQLTDKKTLFFVDRKHNLKELVDGKVSSVNLFEQFSIFSLFYRNNNTLFIEDSKSNVWQYNVDEQTKKMVLPSLNEVYEVTDIDMQNKRLLFYRTSTSSKEVVLFHQ